MEMLVNKESKRNRKETQINRKIKKENRKIEPNDFKPGPSEPKEVKEKGRFSPHQILARIDVKASPVKALDCNLQPLPDFQTFLQS